MVKPNIILILGMHRSGTSVLARVISLLGAKLPQTLLGKNDSNNRGHWESEVLIANHDALLARLKSDWKDWRRLPIESLSPSRRAALQDSFTEEIYEEYSAAPSLGGKAEVYVVKEPRICRFAALYLEAMESVASSVHSLIAVRHPLEIAASLTARDGLPKLEGLFLWLTHMLEAEHATRGRPRSFVTYEGFLKTPVKRAQSIAKALEFDLPFKASERCSEIKDYVSVKLKRHSIADEDIVLDPIARGWISESYRAFQVLAENPNSESALEILDEVRGAYFAALGPLYTALGEQRAQHAQALHSQTQALEQELSRTARAADQQAAEQRDVQSLRDKTLEISTELASREAALAQSQTAYGQMTGAYNSEILRLQQLAYAQNERVQSIQGSGDAAQKTIALYKAEAKAQKEKARGLEAELSEIIAGLKAYKAEAKAQEDKAAAFEAKLSESTEGLTAYKTEAKAQEDKAAALEAKLSESAAGLEAYKAEAKAQEDKALELKGLLSERTTGEAAYKAEAKAQEERAAALEKQFSEGEAALTALREKAAAKEAQLYEYHSQLTVYQEQLMSHKNAVLLYKDEASAQEARANSLDTQMAEQAKAQEEKAAALEAKANQYEAEAFALNKEIDFMRAEFRGLLSDADSKIEGLYGELGARDTALGTRSAQLDNVQRELDGVLRSTSWKLTAGLRRLVNGLRGNKTASKRAAIEDQRGAVKLDYKPYDNSGG